MFRSVKRGEPLEQHLPGIVSHALKKLPTPKVMRWGDGDAQFVRPVHGLIMMLGNRPVPGEVLGVPSGTRTRGHRFMGKGEVVIVHAEDYLQALSRDGSVIASFSERKKAIAEALHRTAAEQRGVLAEHAALLDEVTALVEHAAIYAGGFDAAFLAVPQECLILSMKQHQKYFPLLDPNTGKLLNRFLIVSNLNTHTPQNIVAGNERVLRARLSDAKFFFDQDRKTRLEARVPRLSAVVYHNRLGSQLERVERIQKLASAIAQKLGADMEIAERAAWLCKADLLTDMVGEFPELQGTMGQYYARHDGEDEAVARAIEAHYHPRFAADTLPEDNIGCAVALADKLDTLVGIYGIGLVPTGDKDPFGLRRQALGVLRILSERALPLDLQELLQLAKLAFPTGVLADSVTVDLHGFMLERLRSYLRERDFGPDEIEAVVGQNPTRIDQVIPRLQAVQHFRALPEAQALAGANKRIRNILRKTTVAQTEPDPALLHGESREGPVRSHLAPATVGALLGVQRRLHRGAACACRGAQGSGYFLRRSDGDDRRARHPQQPAGVAGAARLAHESGSGHLEAGDAVAGGVAVRSSREIDYMRVLSARPALATGSSCVSPLASRLS